MVSFMQRGPSVGGGVGVTEFKYPPLAPFPYLCVCLFACFYVYTYHVKCVCTVMYMYVQKQKRNHDCQNVQIKGEVSPKQQHGLAE